MSARSGQRSGPVIAYWNSPMGLVCRNDVMALVSQSDDEARESHLWRALSFLVIELSHPRQVRVTELRSFE